MDMGPFYNICIEELRQAINDGSSIYVQTFPPSEMVSVGANIHFEKGLTGSHLKYCNVHINITNYLAIRTNAPELKIIRILWVWYRWNPIYIYSWRLAYVVMMMMEEISKYLRKSNMMIKFLDHVFILISIWHIYALNTEEEARRERIKLRQ